MHTHTLKEFIIEIVEIGIFENEVCILCHIIEYISHTIQQAV